MSGECNNDGVFGRASSKPLKFSFNTCPCGILVSQKLCLAAKCIGEQRLKSYSVPSGAPWLVNGR